MEDLEACLTWLFSLRVYIHKHLWWTYSPASSVAVYKMAAWVRGDSWSPHTWRRCGQVSPFPPHPWGSYPASICYVLWTLTSNTDLLCRDNYYEDGLLFLIKCIGCVCESVLEAVLEKFTVLLSIVGSIQKIWLLMVNSREHPLLKGGRFT